MLKAILGDIHSNSEALKKVLAELKVAGVDKVYHTGDIVGYCTDVSECIHILSDWDVSGVHGNHDLMALGELSTEDCIRPGIMAIHWTWNNMTNADREYLQSLPDILIEDKIVIFHASPQSVLKRVVKGNDALKIKVELDGILPDWWIGIHGHVHKQRVFQIDGGDVSLILDGEGSVKLENDKRYVICPGSVGISRDFDKRSAYMTLDSTGLVTMKRTTYNWKKTQVKLNHAGLETALYLSKWTYINRKLRRMVFNIKKIIKNIIMLLT